MRFALHGMVTFYSNIISDIRIAGETGYEGLEIHTDKLWRFIKAGGNAMMLNEACKKHQIIPSAIDIIGGIEVGTKENVERVLSETEILSKLAQDIGAETIQLNAFEGLNALSVLDNIKLTAKIIKKIAKIGAQYNIRFQYEGAAWTPIHTLKDCNALIEEVGEGNFGHVIDFWHFWSSRGCTPNDIAKLDKNTIFGVHCCGGTRPPMDSNGNIAWIDERELRGYFPGDETNSENGTLDMLPVKDWVDAIKTTGYDGWVSGEFLNNELWEMDNMENARIIKTRIEEFFDKK